MNIWTETKEVTPENVQHFMLPESSPADLALTQKILTILRKHGIRSTPCEDGVFEGDLSQWSLGPAGSFTNYEAPAPLGFYADAAIGMLSDPGFEGDPEYQNDAKQLLKQLQSIIAELEKEGIPCRPNLIVLNVLLDPIVGI